MTSGEAVPVAITTVGRVASAPAAGTVSATATTSTTTSATATAQEDETSGFELILPVAVLGTAAALAGYGYVRRTRRARTRTTPGGAPVAPSAVPELVELDERARALLVAADDWVRTGGEELDFAEARSGPAAVAPFARALREAEAELAAAFRMRQRYEEGVPEDATGRLQALVGIVGRCEEAGRRLDAAAGDFDRLRGLAADAGEPGTGEPGTGEALGVAEARFRELTARTAVADGVLVDLVKRYGPAACESVAGYVEQVKDRLVFATAFLNAARQSADRDELAHTAAQLRAAEGAVAQAGVFVSGVERLAAVLSEAEALVPATLTGAEAELAAARRQTPGAGAVDVPAGELRARLLHADTVLATVRNELTAGICDPPDALRRIVRACAALGGGRAGVLSAAALLTARASVSGADDFVTTHRGAVGWAARTRLAEARRLLASAAPDALPAADALALEARGLAEQDVRTYGNPYAGADGHVSGVAGAVVGGILLDAGVSDASDAPDGTPPRGPVRVASFGGPTTRGRRGLPRL
ncbi:hypothetical protein QC282_07325 [Streptomyces sp. DH24]|nr:hypothetical protein [Streptomyces sp. DH24]MDG9716424.1 hypothetical protein [Streptomyces sp. DH24]